MSRAMTELERAIRAQPAELERLAGADLPSVGAQLKDRRRLWLAGTGSSQHVAELGAEGYGGEYLLHGQAGARARIVHSPRRATSALRAQPLRREGWRR
jgi:fructoselysine-6-P-deglycase FrlB-like protein